MKTVFITGVSTGIGRAATLFFLKRGECVIGTVREKDSIQDLLIKYPNQFLMIQIDLTKAHEILQIPDELTRMGIEKIDILINNAGVAIAAPFQFQNESEFEQIIQVNLLAVLRLTQRLIPFIQKASDGRIIFISSVSGKNGTPFLAAYCASKHAIEGFAESLRRELNIYGIKVILIGPGSVQTPIWDKGFEKIKNNYKETIYSESFKLFMDFASKEKLNGLSPDVIVQDISKASYSWNPKVRYASIPHPIQNFILSLLSKKNQDRINHQFLKLEINNK